MPARPNERLAMSRRIRPFALNAILLTTVLMSPIVTAAAAEMPPVVAPGAKLQQLTGDCKFTEGPAADKQGDVYFTDQPNDRILKWSASDNSITQWLKPCGRSNGLCFDNTGQLIACADEHNQLWSIDPATKAVTVLVRDYNGKLLNGPNDVWVAPDNSIYFTDPLYPRDYWKGIRDPKPQQDKRAVYYLSPDRKTLKRVIEDLKQPNGIIGTPDGKTLYVADIDAKKTYRYDLSADGTPANKKLHCEMGSDGMTLDERGNLYLTGKGVHVFDPAGKKLGQIDVPAESWTANVCFGGKDRDLLFITASKSAYALKMAVKGAGSQ
jgi:gluconolactonase